MAIASGGLFCNLRTICQNEGLICVLTANDYTLLADSDKDKITEAQLTIFDPFYL